MTVEDGRAGQANFTCQLTPVGGDGPVVVALSVGKQLDGTVQRYAAMQSARETRCLHVALDDRGVEKHLLLLGPASLAVRIRRGRQRDRAHMGAVLGRRSRLHLRRHHRLTAESANSL